MGQLYAKAKIVVVWLRELRSDKCPIETLRSRRERPFLRDEQCGKCARLRGLSGSQAAKAALVVATPSQQKNVDDTATYVFGLILRLQML
jgi:hypothetical protein